MEGDRDIDGMDDPYWALLIRANIAGAQMHMTFRWGAMIMRDVIRYHTMR